MSMHALGALLLTALLAAAPPQDPAKLLPQACDTFTWDVSTELAALQAAPVMIDAGIGGTGKPVRIAPGTLYRAGLHPQAQVTLAARPGKPMLDDDAMAGLLTFTVPADGRYRVSITTGHWIDVVDGGTIVPSLDFQGRRGCPLVHKIVEFELRAGHDLVLQFAGGSAAQSAVVITPVAPPPK